MVERRLPGAAAGAERPRHPWWMGLASKLLNGVLNLLWLTWRVRIGTGAEHLERIVAGDRPVIFAFWHNRLVVCGMTICKRVIPRGRPVALLTSLSRDGELAARMAGARGYGSVRGSSSRGGLTSMRRLHRTLRGGSSVATAPDGPRGPACEAQPGTVMLAKMAGAPIVPLAYAASRAWRLRSWDRLVIPKPFARSVVTLGEPLEVPADLSREGLGKLAGDLERQLDRLVALAESKL